MIQTHYHTVSHMPDANRIVADFVSMKIWGKSGALTNCATMGVVRDGLLVGGVVFHDYRTETGTMQLTIAGEHARWVTRRVINDAMRFPFELMGCGAIWAMISAENHTSLKMNRMIFPNESTVRHAFGQNRDGHMMTMGAEEWKAHRLYRNRPLG